MAGATYYIQPCPVCGRRLQIRVEHLGKQICCRHCGGQFIAADPAIYRADSAQPTAELLERADRLLAVRAEKKGT